MQKENSNKQSHLKGRSPDRPYLTSEEKEALEEIADDEQNWVELNRAKKNLQEKETSDFMEKYNQHREDLTKSGDSEG